ncbi:uncharacterized protein [Phyllobates terribilis]|uniref:uncharacterized protein n=1 Tax=Phyllobates terribilis TaxID=111132 RepID=UPI003CCB3CD2
MTALNENDLIVKLTFKCGQHQMEFLDVMLDIDQDGFIHTDVFRKPTSVNSLLCAASSHPRNLVENIPTGQFLRIRRICSSDAKFETQADLLKHRFRERGYSDKIIQRSYRRAKFSRRKDLLYKKQTPETTDVVRFISTFNAKSSEIWTALKKHWRILQLDPSLAPYISKNPTITYRRSRNLRDMLVHSHLSSNKYLFDSKGPQWGCRPCGGCVACPNIESTKTFTNADNSRTFKITHTVTCNTVGVIYSARCPCNKIYIGMTTRELCRRTREHVLDIRAASENDNLEELKTIPLHFKKFHNCDPSTLKFPCFIRKSFLVARDQCVVFSENAGSTLISRDDGTAYYTLLYFPFYFTLHLILMYCFTHMA